MPASRVHGTAIGIGERVGNTPMDLLLVNLVLMGRRSADLTRLGEYCQVVSDAWACPCRRTIRWSDEMRFAPPQVSRRGADQGVQEARPGAGRRCVFRRSRVDGGAGAGDRGWTDVRPVERDLLAGAARPEASDERVDRILAKAKTRQR